MVGLLFRKMFREMGRSLSTYGVCVLIIAIGFCGYAVMGIANDQLSAARDEFYRLTAFPDAIAEVESAPLQAARALMKVDGVEQAVGRLSETVRVTGLPRRPDSLQDPELKLISIGDGGMAVPYLSQGRMPGKDRRELAAGDGFMAANGLSAGDELTLVFQGRQTGFTISGGGISPENIYMLRSSGDMIPDLANYDAGFVSYEILSQLLGRPGTANEFLFVLRPGADWKRIEEEIKQILEPYGCYQVLPREDQTSVAMLEEELNQLDMMGLVIPFLFLLVAVVILYISLSRMIQQQRLQIGTMMGLGISAPAVQAHYLGYGAAAGLTGGLLGSLLGYWLADPMVKYYQVYFSLPDIRAPYSLDYLIWGTLASTLFCGMIGWMTSAGLSRLRPAEAMRPAAPKAARRFFLEGVPYFMSLFTVPGVMAVRNLTRNWRRTAFSLCGIAMAYMITATLTSMYSMYDVFIFDQLEKSQRQDITVNFLMPVESRQALSAVRHPSVIRAEGILEFGATLRGPAGEKTSLMQAVSQDSQLCLLYDEAGRQIRVQEDGVTLSTHIAKSLGVTTGDIIEVEVEYPRKRTSRTTVTGIAAQYMGSTVYLSHKSAAKISDYGGGSTAVLIQGSQAAARDIWTKLKDAHMVASVMSRQEKLQMYKDMMASMNGIMASMVMLGVVIGVAVIYVSSLISFEELKREIAIMLTLGLKSKECLDVISVSQGILTVFGIVAGIPMTWAASGLFSATMSSDVYTFPSLVRPGALGTAVLLTFAAVFLSGMMMHRKIKKLSPVDLLRERE
jgi:putative ABC transport system permease protein